MSHALARLRDLTRDLLFVRSSTGMDPTPRAIELIGPVRSALAMVVAALEGERAFEPEAEGSVTLGLSDYMAGAITPKLLAALQTAAPKLNVIIKAADRRDVSAKLDQREIEIAVGLLPDAEDWHRREVLYIEDHVCVFSPRQLRLGAAVTLEDYRRLPHLLVSLSGDAHGFVDDALSSIELSRRILVTSPYFLLAGDILEQTPVIATLPRSLAEYCSSLSALEKRELPFASPRFEVAMLWHARDERDARLELVRRLIFDVCKSFT